MTAAGHERSPHAVLNLASRVHKARKIERLLGLEQAGRSLRMLEVGTGSGGIANYFACHAEPPHRVQAVDVVDSRQVHEGYDFALVADAGLPFPDHSFDVVLSNHVIEHVGDEGQQRRHLAELRRVLAPDGIGYLAVPNRWMLVEPHYRLAFLSWWPRPWRSRYLRLFRDAGFYDCEPLEKAALEMLLADSGWAFENVCVEAATVMREIEPGSLGLAVYDRMPDGLKRALLPIMPTLIYRLRRGSAASAVQGPSG